MTPPDPVPSDDEVDRLLRRRLKDTTPEFEARWIELKRALRATPRRRSSIWARPLWSVLLATSVAVAALLLIPRSPRPVATEASPKLAELWKMDQTLAGSTALLSSETRAELLHVDAAQPSSPDSP
ncbi:hypothetical protein [Opitutus terrae]|uniref:Uncharacterized protein n=1 Tax=Opitutus terrae (strain DSM 11246 / JCM 15787 / PB90-1) TaxID=452637 RepID=B1ZS42_OPITP|nr:hypothetical protein [Opitutus terrae]ACB74718.1 hypothetical protein Oter_1433 [Opitutus terrae PB90-1]